MTLPITVLKFGGSVLTDASSLRHAAIEIYRHTRTGKRVVAVVSAIGDRTEQLFETAHQITKDPQPHRLASLVASGERHAASALALAVDAAGLDVSVLDERDLSFIAEGDPLEATPVSLDTVALRKALAHSSVVIVPGYVAEDAENRTLLLGRGGSDLTALFLADRLAAERCLLLKDVDGWFEDDPAEDPWARRFATLSFKDARGRKDPIVQPRAVCFAEAAGFSFEVGRIGSGGNCRGTDQPSARGTDRSSGGSGGNCRGTDQPFGGNCRGTDQPWVPTVVGNVPTVVQTDVVASKRQGSPRKWKVALLGLGEVGQQIFHLLEQQPGLYQVGTVLVRDPYKPRDVSPSAAKRITTDFDQVLRSQPDLIVEALPDETVAYSLIKRSLERGIAVVSANKALIEAHGPELKSIAADRGTSLRHGAAVGGAVPMLETLEALTRSTSPRRVRAVLNGTSGFVLDQIASGSSPEDAVLLAQRKGYAEEDSSADLDGRDAARKLALLLQACGVGEASLDAIRYSGIGTKAGRPRSVSRLVASAVVGGEKGSAQVIQEDLDQEDPLAVPGVLCALEVETQDGQRHVVRGRGAGGYPTAVSLFCDVEEVAR